MRHQEHHDCRIEYERGIKAGRGCGRYEKYRPWITVQDVPSHANKIRAASLRQQRLIHCLSGGEYLTFLQLDFDDRIVEIREQFPLDPNVTLKLCEEYSFRHAGSNFGRNGIVMTTDFLITIKLEDGYAFKALQIKDSQSALTARTQEKLIIEREYWQRQGIKYALRLSSDYNQILCDNLKILAPLRNTRIQPLLLQEAASLGKKLLNYPQLKLIEAQPLLSVNIPEMGGVVGGYQLIMLLLAKKIWICTAINQLPLQEVKIKDLIAQEDFRWSF